MKTTVELPNELYAQAKSMAALRHTTVKDLLTRGLAMVLEEERRASSQPTPLQTMDLIRQKPLHSPADVQKMIQSANAMRRKGWGNEGTEP